MRIMLTEATFEESVPVQAELEAAGFEVYPCHVRSGACQAFTGSCPLDLMDVDVAVVVRSGSRNELTTREYGAICSYRAGVPVVVTSADELPLPVVPAALTGVAAMAAPHGQLVDACRRVTDITADLP